MPKRIFPFATNEIYHVFNRTIARQPLFLSHHEYKRAYALIEYYRYNHPPLRFSHVQLCTDAVRKQYYERLEQNHSRRVSIHAFCLMPNHFHFLLHQNCDNGIQTFMSDVQNSYAKYFNQRHDRSGALFQSSFKGVHIETQEQMLHVARYIHINPTTSGMLKRDSDLANYEWSSYFDYLGKRLHSFVDKQLVLSGFSTLSAFIAFTNDQITYQKQLAIMRHILIDPEV